MTPPSKSPWPTATDNRPLVLDRPTIAAIREQLTLAIRRGKIKTSWQHEARLVVEAGIARGLVTMTNDTDHQ